MYLVIKVIFQTYFCVRPIINVWHVLYLTKDAALSHN